MKKILILMCFMTLLWSCKKAADTSQPETSINSKTVKGASTVSALSTAFNVQSAYLQNGKIAINSSGSTSIKVDLELERLPSTYNSGYYEDGGFIYSVVYVSPDGVHTALTQEVTVLGSSYNIGIQKPNGYGRLQRVVDVTLQSNMVGGYIALKFKAFIEQQSGGYWPTGYNYQYSIYTATKVAGSYYPGNGVFVRTPDQKVYWGFENKLRHIETWGTLNGLFSGWPIQNVNGVDEFFVGLSLGPDNGLINDKNTGKVYFREKNLIRHITSANVFDKYHFNWRSITNTYNISMYTIGNPIY